MRSLGRCPAENIRRTRFAAPNLKTHLMRRVCAVKWIDAMDYTGHGGSTVGTYLIRRSTREYVVNELSKLSAPRERPRERVFPRIVFSFPVW